MKRTFHLILLISFILLRPSYGQDKIDSLDAYISSAIDSFNTAGLAVSIVKDNEVVFTKAYGYKNKEKDELLTTSSLFNIASVSKAFTAAIMSKLVNGGELTWSDKVADYLPAFRLEDPWITAQVDMEDILSHRVGLGTFYGDLLWYNTDYKPEEIISRLRYLPMTNKFRDEFGYSNTMYIVAGEVIKKVSGTPWEVFLDDSIFTPLSMDDSRAAALLLEEDQDIAMPHFKGETMNFRVENYNPAASIYSNVEDMSNWIMMLLNRGEFEGRQILDPEAVIDLFKARTLLGSGIANKPGGTHIRTYGLGWFLYDKNGRLIIEHDGGMPGYISKLVLVPEENFGFVILTNDVTSVTSAIGPRIIDEFTVGEKTDYTSLYLRRVKHYEEIKKIKEEEKDKARTLNTSPSLPLEEYTGTYIDEMYGSAKIELKNGNLFLTLLPTKKLFYSKMQHWHYDTFEIKFKDEFLPRGFVTFNFNSDGDIKGFKIDLPNPDFHFFNLDFKKAEK